MNAEESDGTAPLGWEFQVCRLPSQHTVRIGVGPVVGSLLGVPSPRYPYPLSCSDSRCCFGHGESDRLRRTRSYFVCECSPGACCLIPALGRTLFPVWADTRTASFRALGHTGVVTSAPTLMCTLNSEVYTLLDQKRSGIAAVTARIHAVNGVVLCLFHL